MLTRALGIVVIAACGMLAGCGGGDSGTTTTAPATNSAAGTTATESPIKVGLLVTGSTSDGGWNQLASDSLNKLAASQNIDVRIRQQVTKDTAPDAIRQFEAGGYGIVIAHGYEYQDVAKELTDPSKPDAVKAKIVVSGGDMDNPNFQSLAYDLAGASYQLGIVAAEVSKTGKLGFIGGEAVPPVEAMKRGFEAGAKSVNPSVTVAAQYTGWDDPSKAKKQAEAFMEQGVDVIMQDVDAASRGVFEAVAEHDAKAGNDKVYTFGANSDQNANPVCPDYTLGSAVIKMDVAFDRLIKSVKDGTYKGGLVKEDLANGVSVAVLNPKLVGGVIGADVQPLVDAAAKGFESGTLTVPAQ
jgi:basic membrane protein A